MALSEADKIELTLIGAGALLTYIILPVLPHYLSIGMFALVFAVCLLGQSLIRDLFKLYAIRRDRSEPQRIGIVCMCVESVIGLVGVIAGLAMLFTGIAYVVKIPQWYWPAFSTGTWLFGYVIKNYVIDFTNWRLKRVEDHHNIVIGR